MSSVTFLKNGVEVAVWDFWKKVVKIGNTTQSARTLAEAEEIVGIENYDEEEMS